MILHISEAVLWLKVVRNQEHLSRQDLPDVLDAIVRVSHLLSPMTKLKVAL